jgi:hypothetical protein
LTKCEESYEREGMELHLEAGAHAEKRPERGEKLHVAATHAAAHEQEARDSPAHHTRQQRRDEPGPLAVHAMRNASQPPRRQGQPVWYDTRAEVCGARYARREQRTQAQRQ